jgi:glycosyl transferase family 25
MEIYVINLEAAKDRMAYMHKQLEGLGLRYTRQEAVKGTALTEAEMEQLCDMDAVRNNPHWLRKGVIGCTLSHWKVYQQMVANNVPVALILEDDMKLPNNLEGLLAAIEQNIAKEEVILLYYQALYEVQFSTQNTASLVPPYTLHYPIDMSHIGAGGAYVITLDVAKALLQEMVPVRVSNDCYAYFYERKAISSLRCILPFAATSSFFESTINYVKKDNLFGTVKAFLTKYNVLFAKDVLAWNRRRIWNKQTNYKMSAAVSPIYLKQQAT